MIDKKYKLKVRVFESNNTIMINPNIYLAQIDYSANININGHRSNICKYIKKTLFFYWNNTNQY